MLADLLVLSHDRVTIEQVLIGKLFKSPINPLIRFIVLLNNL